MNLQETLARAKAGSQRDQNDIINNFTPLIKKFLHKKRYYSDLLNNEDFMQYCRIGAWMAIDTFPKHYKAFRTPTGQLYFKEFDATDRFIPWLKMCMQHHITKELRKESQLKRKTDMCYLDEDTIGDETPLRDKLTATRTIGEITVGFVERLSYRLTEKEAICLQLTSEKYNLSKITKEMKKQFPTIKAEEIKMIKQKMYTKVKEEVHGYV